MATWEKGTPDGAMDLLKAGYVWTDHGNVHVLMGKTPSHPFILLEFEGKLIKGRKVKRGKRKVRIAIHRMLVHELAEMMTTCITKALEAEATP